MNKKTGIRIPLLILLILFTACQGSFNSNDQNKTSLKESNLPTIVVQPFGDFSPQLSNYVGNTIALHYPTVRIAKNIPLPAFAFYASRQRYRADSLIRNLSLMAKKEVYIGLTNKDISTSLGNNKDWGVMGLGYSPGLACIASTFRLNKQKDLALQLYKIAIHELGHTTGLPHCSTINCYMQDAEGKNKTEYLTDFCDSCKRHLISKGWKF